MDVDAGPNPALVRAESKKAIQVIASRLDNRMQLETYVLRLSTALSALAIGWCATGQRSNKLWLFQEGRVTRGEKQLYDRKEARGHWAFHGGSGIGAWYVIIQ